MGNRVINNELQLDCVLVILSILYIKLPFGSFKPIRKI